MADESVFLLQLMQTKGIGPRSIARLLDRLDADGLSLRDFFDLDAEGIVARFGFNEEQATSIRAHHEAAAQLAGQLDEKGVRIVLRQNQAYPVRLKSVLADKAPPALFMAGSPEILRRQCVGICGSRNATEAALRSTELLARALVKERFPVVSGHAPGVDETAHRAALEAGGATAFVLPEGILHFRPRPSLAGLLSADQFVVVSEFSPKLPWSVSNAMQRNRTIDGLVRALVVVEAGTKGGTWEAGLEALRLHVPLFVFDYPELSPSAEGNPLLLKKGAEPLACRPGSIPDYQSLREVLESSESPVAERLLF